MPQTQFTSQELTSQEFFDTACSCSPDLVLVQTATTNMPTSRQQLPQLLYMVEVIVITRLHEYLWLVWVIWYKMPLTQSYCHDQQLKQVWCYLLYLVASAIATNVEFSIFCLLPSLPCMMYHLLSCFLPHFSLPPSFLLFSPLPFLIPYIRLKHYTFPLCHSCLLSFPILCPLSHPPFHFLSLFLPSYLLLPFSSFLLSPPSSFLLLPNHTKVEMDTKWQLDPVGG